MFPNLCRRCTRVLNGSRSVEIRMKGRILCHTVGGRQLHLMRSLGSSGERPAVRETEEDVGRREGKDQTSPAASGLNSNRKELKTLFQSLPPATAGSSDPRFTKAPSDGLQDNKLYTSDLLDINISKADLLGVIYKFRRRPSVHAEAKEQGLEGVILGKAMNSFCHMLSHPDKVKSSPELLVIIADILAGTGHIDDLFPYFLAYARWRYPENASMSSLRRISDFTSPPAWYPSARAEKRRLVYHAGPTNSGKTYHALKHFLSAEYAIYCAPLRLLAHEIFQKSNKQGVPCDLLTGDDRQYASGDEELPATHLSCTIEMAKVKPDYYVYDVAVIDEAQMLADKLRGGAWTRAILGLPAREIHMCGHDCAVDIVRRLAKSTGEEVEVLRYDRLVPLVPQNRSLRGQYHAVRPGDCLVVFSRWRIFELRDNIEKATNQKCAIIYGGLPPATRIQQAQLFNDPRSKCNVMVATDAIGMGLNLNIRRIVFHTLEKKDGTIDSSLVKQIAGRAGRYGKKHSIGLVTTFHDKDLKMMHKLLATPEEPLQQAGLSPTTEQIEMFSEYLPGAALHEILDLFLRMAKVHSDYFLCDREDSMELAHMLQDTPMPVRDYFTFCLSPVDPTKPHLSKALHQFAAAFSESRPVTFSALCSLINMPLPTPRTPNQLTLFENSHEVLDLYLWLRMRFPEVFVASEEVRKLQWALRETISRSISNRNFSRPKKGWRKTEEMREGYRTNHKEMIWRELRMSTHNT